MGGVGMEGGKTVKENERIQFFVSSPPCPFTAATKAAVNVINLLIFCFFPPSES